MDQKELEKEIAKEAKLYTVDEVAEMLGIGYRTIYRYIKDKRLKAIRVGQEWRIRHVDYIDFLEKSESNM